MIRELAPKAAATLLKKTIASKGATITHTEALNLVAKLKGYEAWSHMQQVRQGEPNKATIGTSSAPVKQVFLGDALKDHYGSQGDGYAEFSPLAQWRFEVWEGTTDLSYWDWVVEDLHIRDLYTDQRFFDMPAPMQVVLPTGVAGLWPIVTNLSDTEGALNYSFPYASAQGVILHLDEALCSSEELGDKLRMQMRGSLSTMAYFQQEGNAPGTFGTLFEGKLSDDNPSSPENQEKLDLAMKALRKLTKSTAVKLCYPQEEGVIGNSRILAFVPLQALKEAKLDALAEILTAL